MSRLIVDEYGAKYSEAIACLEEWLEDSLQFFSFGNIDHRRIASINVLECLNKEQVSFLIWHRPKHSEEGAKPMKKGLILAIIVMIVGIATAVAEPTHKEEKMTLTLTSAAFTEGGEIPAKHTCEGADISPPLVWHGVPEGTKSLVLIVDDPDAPDPKAPKMTWVHWLLYNLPPSDGKLSEGAHTAELPAGTLEGINDWKRTGFGGPCPPTGRHRYFHKLYALDTVLPDLGTPTKARLEAAMQGHIITQTALVGTYKKNK